MLLIHKSLRVLPYVYYGIQKDTGRYYIGLRTANKLPSSDDFGVVYRTSSKIIKTIGFDKFEWYILAEFYGEDSKIDAYNFEQELIVAAMARDGAVCLNRRGYNPISKSLIKSNKLEDVEKSNKQAKYTYLIEFPDGKTEIATGLHAFSVKYPEMNLVPRSLRRAALGHMITYKGLHVYRIDEHKNKIPKTEKYDDVTPRIRKGKNYRVVTPENQIIIINNLAKFRLENNLSETDVRRVLNGEKETTNGFQFSYI